MTFDIDEVFECTGKKDVTCSVLGCVFYLPHKKEFIICSKFKLKDGYSIYKK